MMDIIGFIVFMIIFCSIDADVGYAIMFLLTAGSGVFLLFMFLFG